MENEEWSVLVLDSRNSILLARFIKCRKVEVDKEYLGFGLGFDDVLG